MANFIIGVGAQFAGQAMLQQVLESNDQVFLHPLKSLHFFDGKAGLIKPEQRKANFNRRLMMDIDQVIDAKDSGFIDGPFKCQLRAAKKLSNVPLAKIDYVDLYRPCVQGVKYLAEMTPDYMRLPEPKVAEMSQTLGKNAKIILIVRNPVNRMMNAFRLMKQKNVATLDGQAFIDAFKKVETEDKEWIKQQDQMNDYQAAFQKFNKHFENVLLFSYDEMLAKPMQSLKQLENFLGETIDPVLFSKLVKQEAKAASQDQVKPRVQEFLENRYQNSIQFLAKKFSS